MISTDSHFNLGLETLFGGISTQKKRGDGNELWGPCVGRR